MSHLETTALFWKHPQQDKEAATVAPPSILEWDEGEEELAVYEKTGGLLASKGAELLRVSLKEGSASASTCGEGVSIFAEKLRIETPDLLLEALTYDCAEAFKIADQINQRACLQNLA